jgi:hypothetical protein
LATNVAAKTLLAFGVSSLVSVAFIAWRRRADFIALVRAAWLWMWWGRLEETPGLVKAMSRQLAVYSGLFFALFVGVGQNRDDKSRTLPAELPQYVTQLSQILDIKLAPIINVRDSCERALVEGRSGLVVYLDKSSESAQSDQPKSNQPEAEQVKFDLIYVALFENASFGPDVKVGRTLSYSERVRLENFANSLRQIADTLRRAGDQAGRLRIEVRGFASDAPKKEHVREKDKENNEVANDRARSVYRFLCGVLKETAADLPPPIIWELPAQMRYNRQLDDGLVQSPEQRQTALAEMPNRRVEILVTLPPGLKVRRVSESIAREELPRR